jgi:hypothetical protein
MSQGELARRLGITAQQVQKYLPLPTSNAESGAFGLSHPM